MVILAVVNKLPGLCHQHGIKPSLNPFSELNSTPAKMYIQVLTADTTMNVKDVEMHSPWISVELKSIDLVSLEERSRSETQAHGEVT